MYYFMLALFFVSILFSYFFSLLLNFESCSVCYASDHAYYWYVQTMLLCKFCLLLQKCTPSGVLYIGKCKADPMIPIWLVVFGSIGLFQSVLNLCKSITENMTDESSKSSRDGFQMAANIIGSILSFFLFVWILAGSIWVFGFYSQFQVNECSSHGNDAECCHPVPYYFSLFILLSMYTFGALSMIIICCCFWCCFCAVK